MTKKEIERFISNLDKNNIFYIQSLKSYFISLFVTISIILILLFCSLIITSEISSQYCWPRSNDILEQPWNQSNLTFYIDSNRVADNDILINAYNTRISFRWWERDGGQYLGYQVNFTEVDEPVNANIIINWNIENYTTNNKTLGHTFINTTNQLGDSTCDTFNPPFTQCNISIKQGLNDAKMQHVITHEIGHAFSLKHSYNENDFLVRLLFGPNYLNTPEDIMIDDDVFAKAYFLLLSLLSAFLFTVSIIFIKTKIANKNLFFIICVALLGYVFLLIFLNFYNIYISSEYVKHLPILTTIVNIEMIILLFQNVLYFKYPY